MTTRVFAIAGHPDDIEFCMAGTLVLLKKAGCEIHYMNMADGSCGSANLDAETTAAVRLEEAKNAAAVLGAIFHPPIAPDLQIFYEKALLAKLGSIVREVAPDILLLPSPRDYMEDHQNTCRLAVSAAFLRTMGNFPVDPPRSPVFNDVTIYHAQPFGNRDEYNHLVQPDFFINIDEVISVKKEMLSQHKSQKEWLDQSQGMDSYLDTMTAQAVEMGTLSTVFYYAEGWRRHNPLGLCTSSADPLVKILDDYAYIPMTKDT